MQYLKRAIIPSRQESEDIESVVKTVISDIRKGGDQAVRKYEEEFGHSHRTLFRVSDEEYQESVSTLDSEVKVLIERTVDRVKRFAEAQLGCLTELEDEFGDGIRMGHRVVPIESVGAYIPGGRFPLLSSAAMVIVPARVAGASRIIACSPANYKGGIHPAVLYSTHLSGATEIYAIGGAQAIAAMAYGTESIRAVDMVAGPGNRYVAEAKRQVYGAVGIDLLAGPSEIMVLADDSANPSTVAVDLLAQAEHDPFTRALLVSTSLDLAKSVMSEIDIAMQLLPNDSPARESWPQMGEVIVTETMDEAIAICNDYAVEHLHIQTRNPRDLMKTLYNYGSLFLGANSSVVFSDKVSGTNHTLPTLRAARYTGGLWVGNYVKVLTHQEIMDNGIEILASHSARQSELEGLEGHRLSAVARIKPEIRP